jgi:3-oxoacyl-[acyl-carrier-protein] synthase II
MSTKVVVTGLGVVSSIGNNVEENYQSLINKKSGISNMVYLDSIHKPNIPVAEVKATDEELKIRLGIEGEKQISRTSLLGIVAVKEALSDSGIADISEFRTGLISATTVGGMTKTELYYKDFLDDTKTGDFLDFIHTQDCGESTERMADYFGIKDYLNTINTACSSSANAVMLGSRLIKHGVLDRVIVGGIDSLAKFTVNGFNSLMILDETGIKPFSNNRAGLNLGEGAGFIVIESEELAKNKKIYSYVSGYANSCDAFHQTASSPEGDGSYASMMEAIEVSGLKPADIDYVNAHGTATEINDLSEGRAIQRVFGKEMPLVSSTKSYTGHTLGACGGIEAVYANLAIDRNTVYPNLNFEEQMEELDFCPTTEVTFDKEVNHVLSNSFGFGGNNSTLIFSKNE